MSNWRFNRNGLKDGAFVGDIWPDVDKTVIYPRLLEWEIDAKKMRVIVDPWEFVFTGGTMAAIPFFKGEIEISTYTLDNYRTDEAKYVGLVHELAHLLHAVEGNIELTGKPAMSPEQWIARETEQDAIHWSAKQAKLMGWSLPKFEDAIEQRYSDASRYILKKIVGAGKSVWVRQHIRKRPRSI